MYSSLRVATVQVREFFFLDLRWGFCESLEGCYGDRGLREFKGRWCFS